MSDLLLVFDLICLAILQPKNQLSLLFHSQNEQSVQMKIETSCRLQFFKLLLPLAYEITLAYSEGVLPSNCSLFLNN
jgi:hypothetical protein